MTELMKRSTQEGAIARTIKMAETLVHRKSNPSRQMASDIREQIKWGVLALLTAPLLVGLIPASGGESAAPSRPAREDTLRAYADRLQFHIGAIMQMKIFDDPRYQDTLAREFNVFVSFVFMRNVEPAPGQFNFRGMDQDMRFAREHQMKLFGASLIYRAGAVAPAWLAPSRTGDWGRPKDEYAKILREWIQTVVRHGGDSYYCWEVVNEPLSNPNQPWQAVFGRDEYIGKAFRYAREANPNVALELNETFGQAGVDRAKTDEFFDLVQRLKSQGVPIDVVGTEMHLEAQQLRPTYLDELRYFLGRARAAGVQVYITEMDLYQGPPGAFPDPMEHQRKIYHDVLATCLADSNCKGFTTWGVSDARSWLTQKVRDPHADAKPLLFDDQYQKKPAYFGLLQALKERAENRRGQGKAVGSR